MIPHSVSISHAQMNLVAVILYFGNKLACCISRFWECGKGATKGERGRYTD